jgi:hypothetical protein
MANFRFFAVCMIFLGYAEHGFPFTTNGTTPELPWPERAGGVAVLVEPRRHPLLVHVVKQFSSKLPRNWRFHIFHGTLNADLARAAADVLNESDDAELFGDEGKNKTETMPTTTAAAERGRRRRGRRVVLTNLGVAGLAPKDVAYNALLTSAAFWDAVQTSTPAATHALVFQTDTCLCGGGGGRRGRGGGGSPQPSLQAASSSLSSSSSSSLSSPPPISAFLQYDYVGAPWGRVATDDIADRGKRGSSSSSSSGGAGVGAHQRQEEQEEEEVQQEEERWVFPPVPVGNGGLSLRSIDASRRVIAVATAAAAASCAESASAAAATTITTATTAAATTTTTTNRAASVSSSNSSSSSSSPLSANPSAPTKKPPGWLCNGGGVGFGGWDGVTPEDVWFSSKLQEEKDNENGDNEDEDEQDKDEEEHQRTDATTAGEGSGAAGAGSEEKRRRKPALALPPPPHTPLKDNNDDDDSNDDDDAPAEGDGNERRRASPPPLSLPMQKLQVGSSKVGLEAMGPIIINSDGTTRRITNWHEMGEKEQVRWG